MSVVDLINGKDKTCFSFEVLPPLKGMGTEKLFESIKKLMEFDPKYINITTHRSETVYKQISADTYEKRDLRRRPGTVAVASAIKHQFNVPVVPHILCVGYSREETEYALLDMQFLGITDLLVLRGDKDKGVEDSSFKGKNHHALDLANQVRDFNKGFFCDGTPNSAKVNQFHFGVAGYPEKHAESPNMEQDIYWLKQKVDAGAEYVVTQLFYDNQKFFSFVEKARAAGITVPIIPGIKPLFKKEQLERIPTTFKVDLPETLVNEILSCNDNDTAKEVGTGWCIKQCKELIDFGVPSIHFYTVGAVDIVSKVAKAIY